MIMAMDKKQSRKKKQANGAITPHTAMMQSAPMRRFFFPGRGSVTASSLSEAEQQLSSKTEVGDGNR